MSAKILKVKGLKKLNVSVVRFLVNISMEMPHKTWIFFTEMIFFYVEYNCWKTVFDKFLVNVSIHLPNS